MPRKACTRCTRLKVARCVAGRRVAPEHTSNHRERHYKPMHGPASSHRGRVSMTRLSGETNGAPERIAALTSEASMPCGDRLRTWSAMYSHSCRGISTFGVVTAPSGIRCYFTTYHKIPRRLGQSAKTNSELSRRWVMIEGKIFARQQCPTCNSQRDRKAHSNSPLRLVRLSALPALLWSFFQSLFIQARF